MTIKEYTKNYKYQNKKSKNKEKEKENLNKSQNILLNKILKNKKVKGNISMDSSINKTIENTLNIEENKKKVLNYLKYKNHEIPKTSIPTPSKTQERDSSPCFFTGNNKGYINKDDNYDSYLTHKNYNYNNRTETNSRKIISNYKSITPIDKNKNNLDNSIEKKKLYDTVFNKKDLERQNIFINESKIKIYNHNLTQNYEEKGLTSDKNIKNIKYIKKEPINITPNKKKNVYNTNKEKNRMKYNYLSSTYSTLIKQHDKLNISVNNNTNNINNNHYNNNKNNNNIHDNHKSYRKKISNNFKSINNSNYTIKKEFNNLQNKHIELFTIKNSNIKDNNPHVKEKQNVIIFFKNLKQEKSMELCLKNQNIIKAVQIKEKKNILKDQFTGFVLLKKNLGNIEKEIKIENNFEKIKIIFSNILSEIVNEEYEFINSNEILKLKNEINKNRNVLDELNNIKNEILLKEKKIKEKDEIIEKREEEYFENQKEYLKLKNDYEKIKLENDKMKEKINSIEKENKKIIEDSGKLKEEYVIYKNKKDEVINNEIKDLESKIKKYKEELKKTNNNNNFKSNFNIGNINSKNKRFSVSYNFKMESLLTNLEKKKNNENKKSTNKFSKLLVSDDKKIKEDTEDKNEKESEEESNSNSDESDSDKLKENKDNKIEENKNDIIEIKETKKEKEKKIEEPVIKSIIINNISNNINNTNEILVNKVNSIPNNIQNEKTKTKIQTNNPIQEVNEEKQKKMSKALNRFKKKMSVVLQNSNVSSLNNNGNERSSYIKKSDRISGMAKLLEKQIGGGNKEEKNEIKENRPVTEVEESNIVDLIKKKPIAGGRKRKPTLHMKLFNQKNQGE